jgi:arginine utilization protein RocB
MTNVDKERAERLLKSLEDNYKRGCKLADDLKKTSVLHQKLVDSLHNLISKLIEEGDLETAELRINGITKTLEELEFKSISSHIQDKLMGLVEGNISEE